MKWFQGSIPEAVNVSKSKKAIFVVFIEGKDETSQEVHQNIDSDEVSSKLESDKFVAIKIQSDSDNYKFFAEIYQLVPVPSIFFINNNGIPVEIISNKLAVAELATKIDNILTSVQSVNSCENTSESKEDTCTSPAESANVEPTGSSPDNNKEDLKKAKELLESCRKSREKEEKKKEREQEINRRKIGREVQKMKIQQQEKELKLAYEEKKKENAAASEARQKILQQIEEDKLERKRKYELHRQEEAEKLRKKEEALKLAEAQKKIAPDKSKTRIQFKLPTGGSTSAIFDTTNTLSMLRAYVVENIQLPFRDFTMSSSFPRRDFTITDDKKTLLELELVPSSVILILPIKSSNSSIIKSNAGVGIFSHFFWSLVTPVINIYNYVMGYFTGRPRDGSNQNQDNNRGSGNFAMEGASNILSRGRSSPRTGANAEKVVYRRGNIHTLHSRNDDNDENNTWNGNSTQQM